MSSRRFVHVIVERQELGLFVQHRDNKPGIYDPDKLGSFGGHVDSTDADELSAGYRELAEETDLTEVVLRALGGFSVEGFTPQGEPVQKNIHVFHTLVPAERPIVIGKEEGQGGVTLLFNQPLPATPELTETLMYELQRYYPERFDTAAFPIDPDLFHEIAHY